jgi:hypothetical protein
MQGAFTIDELFEACAVLFGPGVRVSLDFLKYLKPEGVRAAYRRQVKTSHPDRALVTGKDAGRMQADFIRATEAYRKLHQVVSGKGSILPAGNASRPRVKASAPSRGRRRGGNSPAVFHRGSLPARKLLFCQYLYYSGCISWDACIDAIVWQRRHRPTVGRIARDLGMLSEEQVQSVLRQRTLKGRFGDRAIRLGFLTPYQLTVLLGKQRLLKRRVGDYFISSGVLSRRQVERMALKQSAHNRNF